MNLYHIHGGDDLAMDLHGPLGYVVTEQIASKVCRAPKTR